MAGYNRILFHHNHFPLLQTRKPNISRRFSVARNYLNHHLNNDPESKSHKPINPKPSSFTITEAEIQSEFAHHDPGVARINNGSFGSCPGSVFTAWQQWQLRFLRQPDHFYVDELQKGLMESRTIIKHLVNADDVDEIAILDNATTAVAVVLQHTAWAFVEGVYKQGDAIVMLCYAYGAVKKSIKAYFSRAGGFVIEVQFKFPVSSNDEIVSEFRKALEKAKDSGRRVRLALIDHVTSMPSVLIPVKELVKICREEGVDQVLVDAAHGVGCIDVDVKEIGADFYTSNLYKWFFCPPSVGFLHCRNLPKWLDLHHPIVSHEYGNGLARECGWVGTRDYSPLLVVPSALEFINRFQNGIDGIKKRNHDEVVEMGKMLAQAWGTNLGSPPDMCTSMIMVGLPSSLGVASEKQALKLRTHLRKSFGVEVPIYYEAPSLDEESGSMLTGYARISHQVYNKTQDYHKFRDAVNQLVCDGFSCAFLPS
ncbi:Glycine dehydrogenase (decarboxylating) [Parasponia andersonii]|uniref:Glycine dehydrogenase (Decarboxylating) n=1 Tax=Parasponia andersonii TaxID=3476 RepID=A0A2P5D8E3_PARAD|nr:Glycine dehydrogenase (decarboxylating) [Parasponia andersonii]